MMKTKVKKEKRKVKHKLDSSSEIEESTGKQPSSDNIKSHTETADSSLKCLNLDNRCEVNSALDNTLHKEHSTEEEPIFYDTNESELICCDEETLIEPSAPLMLEDCTNNVQYKSELELFQEDEMQPQFNEISDIAESLLEMKPYTEVQLLTLYDNYLLNDKELMISDFLDIDKNILNSEFYEIVQVFLDARMSLIRVEEELTSCNEMLKKLHKSAWTFEEQNECEDDVCLDNVVVKANFKHETAHFQEHIAKKLVKYSKKIRTVIFDSHTLYVYQAELQKVRAENFLQNVISEFSKSQDLLTKYAPVMCSPNGNYPPNGSIKDLKECISVLFSFCRKGINDDKFNRAIKSMLCDAVALLLRYASYADNFFILNHLLRCPAGVGDWGSHFIQVPSPSVLSVQSMFGCPELDYALTILSVILSPIKQRDKFMSCYKEHRNKNEDVSDCDWVVIDCCQEGHSSSEDSGKQLRENDIIQFLDQIPFEGIFKHILGIEDDTSDCFKLNTSVHSIMKLFAFSTSLLKVFENGLLTYSKPEYQGVSKRICRLISHTILYVSQHWKEYQTSHLSSQRNTEIEEESMFRRLQVEYDEFMERIVSTVFHNRNISGCWELLCAMPYNIISTNKLCKLLCNLFTGYTETISSDEDYRELISNSDIAERFFDFASQLDDYAVFYFLTALSNMAIMRQRVDRDIIEIITVNIFKASFIKNDGKEAVNRAGRDVLSSIANSHSFVISSLLESLQENVSAIGCPALYFFTHLDLANWLITPDDVECLSNWILCPPNSLQNQLSRTILGKLNWRFTTDGELFLNKSIHTKVILSLVEAYTKVYKAQHVGSNLISSSVKQVTSVVYSSSQEQIFLKWCWLMAGNLRLHHMDQSASVVQNLIIHPFSFLRNIPDPMSSMELSLIKLGIQSNEPFCIFAAHLMSTWGHSIPEFCINGPKSLEILVAAGHYEAAITILFLITPMFFQQREELTSNVAFVKAVQSILSTDKKYAKIAIRMVSYTESGEAWELLSSLIITQMDDYKKFNLSYPCTIVTFWINVLLSLPNCTTEGNVVNILNVICEHSIKDRQCWNTLKESFVEELKVKMVQQNKASTLTSLLSWVTFSSEGANMLTKYSNPKQPWFALLALQCEAQIQNSLWKRLLQLLESDPNVALATAVKDACLELNIAPINPNLLSLYRFGQQILDLAVDHPSFSVTLQGFLTLHLARTLPESRTSDCTSVIRKFYEGFINSNFLKKIQQKVKDFMILSTSTKTEERESPSKTVKLLQAMGMWLENPKFSDAGLYLPSLSPIELPKRFRQILENNWDIWLELLDFSHLEQSKEKLIGMWEGHRVLKECPSPTASPSLEPAKRKISVDLSSNYIFKKVNEYDPPKNPPPLFAHAAALQLNISLDQNNLIFDIDRVIDMFHERANNVTLMAKELCALDCVFLELIPSLWSNKIKKTVINVACTPSRLSKLKKCTGPADIIIEYSGKQLNEEVKAKLTCNREKRASVITQSTRSPTMAMSQAALKLEKIIQKVIASNLDEGNRGTQKSDCLTTIGRKIFYHLLGKISDETSFYPPAKQLLLDGINSLGQQFISGHCDCQLELVGRILNSDNACNSLLSCHFTPMISAVDSFLQLYEMASTHASSQPDVTFMLLSKFELQTVLRKEQLSASGRRKLIQIITSTLTALLGSGDASTQICSELYRVHLNTIFSYNFFDHCSDVLSSLFDLSFFVVNDSGKIINNLWFDYINTLAKGISVFHCDMNMTEVFAAIKLYVEGQNLLNKLLTKNLLQYLTDHFGAKRVQFGLHGLYPKYKGYVKPIAILLGMLSCLSSQDVASTECELTYMWSCMESLFGPWLCPMGKDLKESCPKWVQEFSHDKHLLLPWTPSINVEPEYMTAIFAGVAQFIYESSNDNIILSKLLDFYCRTFANEHIKDHVLAVVHSSFVHVYWHHLSPSIKDMESIYRIMNEYLPECHSFIGRIFVQVDWSKVEEYFSQHDTTRLVRFNVLFLNILIRVAMDQSVRQESNNLRQVIVNAECFHWELLDLSSFENVINWFVMSCDPRIVLNSETRNSIDVAVINILHKAAGFTPNVTAEHDESPLKRCLLVRALSRLLITCSKKHNILLVSRLPTFEQTFAILFNHLENTIINAIPKDRQYNEAIDLAGEALSVIEGGSVPSTLQEVCRNSLINWLQGHHTSDIFLLPLLVTISKNVLQLQHRCALLEESIRAVYKHQESKDDSDRLLWPDIVGSMSFPLSSPMAMFHYAAQDNDLFVVYAYCRWKLTVKRDADESLLLSNLIEIFPKLQPNEKSEPGFVLLISLILDLIKSQVELTGSHKLGLWRHSEILASLLDNFGIDSFSTGILGVFGFGKESCLPTRSRLLCRCLSAFMSCQLVQPGCFRSLNEPTSDDNAIPLQDTTAQALVALNSLKKNSLYAEFKAPLDWVICFIQNYCHSILDSNILLAGLVKLLYFNDVSLNHLTFKLIYVRSDPVIEKLFKIAQGQSTIDS